MKNHVTIVGGVTLNNSILVNVAQWPTILSGDGRYRVVNNYLISNAARLYGDTIVDGNTAETGGRIYNSNSSPTVVNSILWGNGDKGASVNTKVYYSIVEGESSNSINNIITLDSKLGELDDNGGGISTIAI